MKVYVLTGDVGCWDDAQTPIIGIYEKEQDAIDEMDSIYKEMYILRTKYTYEEYEKLDDEIDEFVGIDYPQHLTEFLEHQSKTFYSNLVVTEYSLK